MIWLLKGNEKHNKIMKSLKLPFKQRCKSKDKMYLLLQAIFKISHNPLAAGEVQDRK